MNKLILWLEKPHNAATLAFFRAVLGLMILISIIRFWFKGWIVDLYVEPQYYFTYYGWEWVKPLGYWGMHALYAVIGISALMVAVGWKYRWASILLFASFTYSELIDKSNYLNHYYFVSLVSGLMIFLPAHRYFSIDACLNPNLRSLVVPNWSIWAIRLQLGIVYFFAGVAKLNYDWLFRAMPLRLWLAPHTDLPIIGSYLGQEWTAYFFSWFGAIYDLTIPFFLIWHRSRPFAYIAVLIFHIMTHLLFQIGMFPFIMIMSTLIFFDASFHQKVLEFIKALFPTKLEKSLNFPSTLKLSRWVIYLLIFHFTIQIVYPFRYLLYPGPLFWREEGFRFSWRVMLMEKAGYATFYVQDSHSGKTIEVAPEQFLKPHQVKQMSFQPDMILQFAHFLRDHYHQKGFHKPQVRAEVYVTLNGEGSRLMIDPTVDLAQEREGFLPKKWILPYHQTNVASNIMNN